MINEITSQVVIAPLVNSSVAKPQGVREASRVSESQNEVVSRQSLIEAGNSLPSGRANESRDTANESLIEAMDQIEQFVQIIDRDLQFRVDEESGRTIITVVDAETDEVVRVIPSEEMQAVARALANGEGLLGRVEA